MRKLRKIQCCNLNIFERVVWIYEKMLVLFLIETSYHLNAIVTSL